MMNIRNITLAAAVAASTNAIKINSTFNFAEAIANAGKHDSQINAKDLEDFIGNDCMYCMQPAIDTGDLLGGEKPADPSPQKAPQVLAQVETESFWDDIGDSISDAAKWTEGAAKTVGNGVADAAKTVGNGVADAAKTVGNGVAGATVGLGGAEIAGDGVAGSAVGKAADGLRQRIISMGGDISN